MDINHAISVLYTPEEIERVNQAGRIAIAKEVARLAAIAPEREKLKAFLHSLSCLEVPECEIRPLLSAKLDELTNIVMERIGYEKEAA